MNGLMQASFYFGYMLMVCYGERACAEGRGAVQSERRAPLTPRLHPPTRHRPPGFFLMLGSVGFRASLGFVRHIYRAIKCE